MITTLKTHITVAAIYEGFVTYELVSYDLEEVGLP